VRRFTLVLCGLLGLFAISALSARALGGAQHAPETWLFGVGDCPQPCWHGIRPGQTSAEDAEAILRSLPYVAKISRHSRDVPCDLSWFVNVSPPYWGCAYVRERRVERFWLMVAQRYHLKGMPIRKALIALGSPDRARLCDDGISNLRGTLYFGANVSVQIVRYDRFGYPFPLRRTQGYWVGEGSVESIAYTQAASPSLDAGGSVRWMGFTPMKRGYRLPPRSYMHTNCG
jgi:hypothetical protein